MPPKSLVTVREEEGQQQVGDVMHERGPRLEADVVGDEGSAGSTSNRRIQARPSGIPTGREAIIDSRCAAGIVMLITGAISSLMPAGTVTLAQTSSREARMVVVAVKVCSATDRRYRRRKSLLRHEDRGASVTHMPADIQVARIDPDDTEAIGAVLAMDQLVWSDDLRTPRESALRDTPSRAAWIATVDGEDAGIAGSWDIELSIPAKGGASLRPTEGLTWVGVHPDHRRKGVLRALMREHLRWTRDEQHRTLAALKASEAAIYGRYGYGIATRELMSTFAQGTTFAAPSAVEALAGATTTRMSTVDPEHAERLHALAQRCGTVAAGQIVRSVEDFARILTDIPETRGEREPARLLWATRDGEDVGCAWFHRTPKWSNGAPDGKAGVFFVMNTDMGARLALARRLTTLDLMASTEYWTTLDDPLVLWQSGQRPHGAGVSDDLWLRIVDLPGAVAERGHAADLDVTVDVTDATLPENAGTWRWTAQDGVGVATRHDGPADLTLDIADLGALWLGDQTVGARALAGYVTEHRPGTVVELDAALRTSTLPIASLNF